MQLKEKHNKQIIPKMSKDLGKNILNLPHLDKVVISVGIGPFKDSDDIVESVKKELAEISGQKPKTTVAKKSISGFKIREGEVIGLVVTLRGKRMWSFTEKLINIVMPRIRDFSGIRERSIDRNGNLNIAVREHVIFPEIRPDETKTSWGMTITLTLKNNEKPEVAKEYYKLLGFVFTEE